MYSYVTIFGRVLDITLKRGGKKIHGVCIHLFVIWKIPAFRHVPGSKGDAMYEFRSGKFFAQKDTEDDCWEKGIFIEKNTYFGYLCFKTSWVYILSIPKVMIVDRTSTPMPMLSWRLGKFRGKTILLCQEIGMVEGKNPAAPVIAEQFAEGMASLHRSTAFWPDFGSSSNKTALISRSIHFHVQLRRKEY